MTVESGECNGKLEVKGGDLKQSGPCEVVEEVGGAFVIVNGVSDEHSDKDLDPEEDEKKLDPASDEEGENGHEVKDKEENVEENSEPAGESANEIEKKEENGSSSHEVEKVAEVEEANGGGESLRENGGGIDEVEKVASAIEEVEEENDGGESLRENGEDGDGVSDEQSDKDLDPEEEEKKLDPASAEEGGNGHEVKDKGENVEENSEPAGESANEIKKKEENGSSSHEVEQVAEVEENGGGEGLRENGDPVAEDKEEAEVFVVERLVGAIDDEFDLSAAAVEESDPGAGSDVKDEEDGVVVIEHAEGGDGSEVQPEEAAVDKELETSVKEELQSAVTEADVRHESEFAVTEKGQASEVTVAETDGQQEPEIAVYENDKLVGSEIPVAETNTGLESEVAVAKTGNQQESDIAVSENDKLVGSEIPVAETDSGLESEIAVVKTGGQQESEIAVAENDSHKESEYLAEVEHIKESETKVGEADHREEMEPDLNSEQEQEHINGSLVSEDLVGKETENVKVQEQEPKPEHIDNSQVQGLEPEPELSVLDNVDQGESESWVEVEVEVKELETEVRAAAHLQESELEQTNENSVSESGEPATRDIAEFESKKKPEALVVEDEKVEASEVDEVKVEEQRQPEPLVEEIFKLSEFISAAAIEPSHAAVIESKISQSLPVDNKEVVDEMPSYEADSPTSESSNSTGENGKSDSVYDHGVVASTTEKDEKVGDLSEADESKGFTNEMETEKEPEPESNVSTDETGTEKEPEQDNTCAATQATLEIPVVKWHHVFMVKIPRFTDDELQKKIQQAVSTLEEKTRFRDSIQEDIRKSMVVIDQHNEEIAAISAEENVARVNYNAKRKELDGVQVLINRINSASSIADIDEKIRKMVHSQQHETIDLKREKQYIHEINQLKRFREQLPQKNSSQEQIDDTLSQRSEIERRFENLKKELVPINNILKSARDRKQAAWKRCEAEKDLLRNLRVRYQVANGPRQEAYGQLLELRKQSSEKFKHFSIYRADQNAAANYRFCGDNEGLRSHCAKQIERVMELWNNKEDFRKEYMKSNVKSTLRRLGTLDGRSLGPDEVAPSIVYDNYKTPNNRSQLASNVHISSASEVKQEPPKNLATPKLVSTNHTAGLKSAEKLIPLQVMPTTRNHQEPQEEDVQENKLEELARKEEQLRKEEELASSNEDKLREEKEKLRMEQKEKAKDAEERKRRKDEKTKAKAKYKVKKEAEEADLKEQKKARKEMKRSFVTSTANGDMDEQTVSVTDTLSRSQGAEAITSTVKRRTTRPAIAAKKDRVQPLPLPLRNRGRRKMTSWMWVLLIAVLVLLLFLVGNYLSF